jgi:hypothetical protein
MHIITKAMKLFSLPLITLLFVNVLLYAQAPTTWVLGTQYNSGSIVGYGDNYYRAIQDVPGSVGGTPDTLTDYWVDIFSTKPTVDPEDPPTTEPDTSDSDLGNLEPPEDNDTIAPAPDSRLINLSTRGFVGTRETDQHMVGGFFINGSESLKVFVKCNGPTLGQLGVTGSISDLKVTIKKFPSEEVVLENDNWSALDVEWSEIVEAYQPLTDKDAAAFLTLSPGLYTTEVEGVNGATGNGQIEIYTYRELQKR